MEYFRFCTRWRDKVIKWDGHRYMLIVACNPENTRGLGQFIPGGLAHPGLGCAAPGNRGVRWLVRRNEFTRTVGRVVLGLSGSTVYGMMVRTTSRERRGYICRPFIYLAPNAPISRPATVERMGSSDGIPDNPVTTGHRQYT